MQKLPVTLLCWFEGKGGEGQPGDAESCFPMLPQLGKWIKPKAQTLEAHRNVEVCRSGFLICILYRFLT